MVPFYPEIEKEVTIEESQNVYPMKLEVYISVHPDAVEGQQMKM